jgi:hypothetical protein
MKRHALTAALLLGLAACGGGKSLPSDTRNHVASLPATPQLDPHGWRVITSVVRRKEGTTSLLFGNDAAVKAARAGRDAYPPGAVLSLVTWKSQEDANWFGATVPAGVQSVEQVTFPATGGEKPSYVKYQGSALKQGTVEPASAEERAAYIVRQRAAVMP